MKQPRHLDLADENLDAIGSFLEYLYTGDYFPKKIPGQRNLESDPAIPSVDDDGDQLLRHARVYTLANKFGLPELKALASSKIHCVNSTAKGEIAYARYVYGHTTAEDGGVRAPVAQFWATRSHVLRSEAEEEFRGLCLEFPQFGYDVLSESSFFLGWLGGGGGGGGGDREREGVVCLKEGFGLTGTSARARREAQEGQQGEDAAARGQREEEAEAEPRLIPNAFALAVEVLLGSWLGAWERGAWSVLYVLRVFSGLSGHGVLWMGGRDGKRAWSAGNGLGGRYLQVGGLGFAFTCTIEGTAHNRLIVRSSSSIAPSPHRPIAKVSLPCSNDARRASRKRYPREGSPHSHPLNPGIRRKGGSARADSSGTLPSAGPQRGRPDNSLLAL